METLYILESLNLYSKSMVTNLTAEAKAKWAEVVSTKDPVKKLQLLQEFYSIMPHHKGTKKLEMMVKRQIAALKQEIEELKRKGATRFDPWTIKKGESPVVALVSTLEASFNAFRELTGLSPTIYQICEGPAVGPFRANDVIFQIYLTPFAPDILGRNLQEKLFRVIRNVDIVLIFNVDRIFDPFKEFAELHNLEISPNGPKVSIRRVSSGGIRFVGPSINFPYNEAESMLKEFNIKNAIVEIRMGATLDDLEAAIFGREFKRALIIDGLPSFTESWKKQLSEKLLEKLELMRVYTRSPNDLAVGKPLLVEKGSSIIDVAHLIHEDLAKHFKYAKLYRNGKTMKVGKDFKLEDGDLIEIYT